MGGCKHGVVFVGVGGGSAGVLPGGMERQFGIRSAQASSRAQRLQHAWCSKKGKSECLLSKNGLSEAIMA